MSIEKIIEVKGGSLSADVVVKRNVPRSYVNIFRAAGVLNKKQQVTILSDINISIYKGDRVALVGSNGAGKSSLLRLLAGIYAPDSGTVTINGRVDGLFSSNASLNQEASGYENIYLRCCLLGIPRAEFSQKVDDIKEFSELNDGVLRRPVKTYSTGMRLRLNTAMIFLVSPSVLLMDEWIGAGDKHFKKKVQDKMEMMMESIDALVIATHNKKIISELGCTEVKLESGCIVDTAQG